MVLEAGVEGKKWQEFVNEDIKHVGLRRCDAQGLD